MYQMHRSTYRKIENLIQNLNQRTPSIVEYQAGRTTYIMMKNLYWRFMGRPILVNEN
jgi:archaellum biogenesis protein FlaJ (TadC family)